MLSLLNRAEAAKNLRGMKCLIVLIAMIGIGAGPATKPASRPAQPDVATAQTALATATAQAVAAFDASPIGKRLVADVMSKQALLDAARAGGDPQAKLDASSAFNRSRQALQDGRNGAVKASQAVAEATGRLLVAKNLATMDAEAEKAKADAAQAAADAEASRPKPMTEIREEEARAKGLKDLADTDRAIRRIEDRLKGSLPELFEEEKKLALAKLDTLGAEASGYSNGGYGVTVTGLDPQAMHRQSPEEKAERDKQQADIKEAKAWVSGLSAGSK